jgi:hypothetical protein
MVGTCWFESEGTSTEAGQVHLNQVAAAFTFNIYSPMTVKVTCAAGGSMSSSIPPPDVDASSVFDGAEVAETPQAAAVKSVETGEPVRVKGE